MPLPMERSNKAMAFLRDDDTFAEYSLKDREFVALMLKHHQNLEKVATEMGTTYATARRRLKDPGVASLLGSIASDFNELARYSLPRIFEQSVENATLDPLALIRACNAGAGPDGEYDFAAFEAALEALPRSQRCAIQEWGYDKHGKPFVKLANRVQSLDLLFRFFDKQRGEAQDAGRESLGIQVILRAPDGSTTEVRAIAGPEQAQTVVDVIA